jgi:hypothetical protein
MWSATSPSAVCTTSVASGWLAMSAYSTSVRVSSKWLGQYMGKNLE